MQNVVLLTKAAELGRVSRSREGSKWSPGLSEEHLLTAGGCECVCVCVCVCVAYTLPCIHSQALPGFVGPGRRVWGHHTAPGTTQAKFTASEEMFENTSQCYWSFPRADMSTHPWGHCTTRRGVVWCGLGRWFRWLTPQKDFLRPCA